MRNLLILASLFIYPRFMHMKLFVFVIILQIVSSLLYLVHYTTYNYSNND